MPNETPYRAPVVAEKPAPAPRFVLPWADPKRAARGAVNARAFGLVAELALVWAVGRWSPVAALVAAVGLSIFEALRKPLPNLKHACVLDVAGGELAVTPADRPRVTTALSAVRDVEIERKSSQSVAHQNPIGDSFGSPQGGADLDVARIAVVLDGDAPRVRLTEEYAPVFICLEQFGKVRSFLRSHGWKPESERD